MVAAGEDTPGAQAAGFAIMDSIGALSRRATVNTTVGDQLTKALIKCMFVLPDANAFPNFPGGAIYNFAAALNQANGGAYYTRGPGAGSDSVVLATDYSDPDLPDNLSGVAPPAGKTWSSILTDRVLVFGYPTSTLPQSAANPLEYEWSTVPANANWNPFAVVAVCDGDGSNAAMVHESNVGVLAFANSASSICSQPQRLVLETGWGPRAIANRLARLLKPEPLHATLRGTGTTGAATFKSKFKKLTVNSVVLAKVGNAVPPAVITGTAPGTTFPVHYHVSTAAGDALFGTCVYLTGSNNNGTPTGLTGPRQCPTPAGMIDAAVLSVLTQSTGNTSFTDADFGQVGVTKVGGIVFRVFADVVDRNGASAILQYKSNVKPTK